VVPHPFHLVRHVALGAAARRQVHQHVGPIMTSTPRP
jgi:hypothetical protein